MHRGIQVHAETAGAPGVILRPLFKDGDNPWLANAQSSLNELGGEKRFAGSGRTSYQHAVTLRNASSHHRVQRRHAAGKTIDWGDALFARGQSQGARECLQASVSDTDGVQPRNRCLPAYFHDLQLAHDGVSFQVLREPEEAVRNGKYGIVDRK